MTGWTCRSYIVPVLERHRLRGSLPGAPGIWATPALDGWLDGGTFPEDALMTAMDRAVTSPRGPSLH